DVSSSSNAVPGSAVASPGAANDVAYPARWVVAGPVGPGRYMLTTRSELSATDTSTGSDTQSAPAGIVTESCPPKVTSVSASGSTMGVPAASSDLGATVAAATVSGSVP